MATLFNVDFFRSIALLRHPSLLVPDARIRSLNELPPILRSWGIQTVIFDVDQTLAGYTDAEPSPAVCSAIRIISSSFHCCILSNVPSTPDKRARLKHIGHVLGLQVVSSPRKKPSADAFVAALRVMKAHAATTAMVGDRIFTDIIGANSLQLKTVRVSPIDWRQDPFLMVTIPRFIELICLSVVTR
jgi:HAD superfamily phosphatase (TIGR01668 family)